MDTSKRLRPGRHQLSRDEVKANQRERILAALETVMGDKGYLDTSVADIIKVAGVSRQTFYELFADKQECFLAGYGLRQRAVIDFIVASRAVEPSLDAFGALLRTYLTVMAADPGLSRLYLVGVYTAGPEAVAKRLELQQEFVHGVQSALGARTEQDRFTCQALVAAVSTLVTNAVLDDDPQAVLDLHGPLVEMASRLVGPGAAGA